MFHPSILIQLRLRRDMLEDALRNLQEVRVKLSSGEKVGNLSYADDLACLYEFAEHARRPPNTMGLQLHSTSSHCTTPTWLDVNGTEHGIRSRGGR